MSPDCFKEQRLQMVAAIWAITDHIAAEIKKVTLDDRVLQAIAKVPRHRGSALCLPEQAIADWLRQDDFAAAYGCGDDGPG